MGLWMALWWAPVGLVWAGEEDHTTPSKHGARCRATFPRIVLDKDVGGEVQGPGEGHGASERTSRSRHGVIFHRETHSGGGNAGWTAARNKAPGGICFN